MPKRGEALSHRIVIPNAVLPRDLLAGYSNDALEQIVEACRITAIDRDPHADIGSYEPDCSPIDRAVKALLRLWLEEGSESSWRNSLKGLLPAEVIDLVVRMRRTDLRDSFVVVGHSRWDEWSMQDQELIRTPQPSTPLIGVSTLRVLIELPSLRRSERVRLRLTKDWPIHGLIEHVGDVLGPRIARLPGGQERLRRYGALAPLCALSATLAVALSHRHGSYRDHRRLRYRVEVVEQVLSELGLASVPEVLRLVLGGDHDPLEAFVDVPEGLLQGSVTDRRVTRAGTPPSASLQVADVEDGWLVPKFRRALRIVRPETPAERDELEAALVRGQELAGLEKGQRRLLGVPRSMRTMVFPFVDEISNERIFFVPPPCPGEGGGHGHLQPSRASSSGGGTQNSKTKDPTSTDVQNPGPNGTLVDLAALSESAIDHLLERLADPRVHKTAKAAVIDLFKCVGLAARRQKPGLYTIVRETGIKQDAFHKYRKAGAVLREDYGEIYRITIAALLDGRRLPRLPAVSRLAAAHSKSAASIRGTAHSLRVKHIETAKTLHRHTDLAVGSPRTAEGVSPFPRRGR